MGLSCTGLRLLRTPSKSNPGVSVLKMVQTGQRFRDAGVLPAVSTRPTAHEALIAPVWLIQMLPSLWTRLNGTTWSFSMTPQSILSAPQQKNAFYFQLASLISEFLTAAERFSPRIGLTALPLSLLNTSPNSMKSFFHLYGLVRFAHKWVFTTILPCFIKLQICFLCIFAVSATTFIVCLPDKSSPPSWIAAFERSIKKKKRNYKKWFGFHCSPVSNASFLSSSISPLVFLSSFVATFLPLAEAFVMCICMFAHTLTQLHTLSYRST